MIIVQVHYQALLLMIAGVSDITATLHFGTGWKSFQLFLLLSEKVMAQTSNWHFIAFSFDSFNGKGLFVVDKRIGFDKKTSDGKTISRKGIYFDVKSPEWITGIFFLLITIQQFHILT